MWLAMPMPKRGNSLSVTQYFGGKKRKMGSGSRIFHGVPAMSVRSESASSVAGAYVTSIRSSLDPKNGDMLSSWGTMLAYWSDLT